MGVNTCAKHLCTCWACNPGGSWKAILSSLYLPLLLLSPSLVESAEGDAEAVWGRWGETVFNNTPIKSSCVLPNLLFALALYQLSEHKLSVQLMRNRYCEQGAAIQTLPELPLTLITSLQAGAALYILEKLLGDRTRCRAGI